MVSLQRDTFDTTNISAVVNEKYWIVSSTSNGANTIEDFDGKHWFHGKSLSV
jgi:hypothetical protein